MTESHKVQIKQGNSDLVWTVEVEDTQAPRWTVVFVGENAEKKAKNFASKYAN